MTDEEKAKFVLAVITNENLQISAAVAKPMVECQEWMQDFIDERVGDSILKEVKGDGTEKV